MLRRSTSQGTQIQVGVGNSRPRTCRDLSGDLSRKFYEAQANNLTPAAIRSDHGAAVISLGVSIAALFLMLRLRTFRDLFHLGTLATRRGMFWMATAAWWGWVPAQLLWLQYTLERGDYPWWADNIAIPIAEERVLLCAWFSLCAMRLVSLNARSETAGRRFTSSTGLQGCGGHGVFNGTPFMVCARRRSGLWGR